MMIMMVVVAMAIQVLPYVCRSSVRGDESRMKLSNLCIGPHIGSKCLVFHVVGIISVVVAAAADWRFPAPMANILQFGAGQFRKSDALFLCPTNCTAGTCRQGLCVRIGDVIRGFGYGSVGVGLGGCGGVWSTRRDGFERRTLMMMKWNINGVPESRTSSDLTFSTHYTALLHATVFGNGGNAN